MVPVLLKPMRNGKGSRPRNCYTNAYRDGWDSVFGKNKSDDECDDSNLENKKLKIHRSWVTAKCNGTGFEIDAAGRIAWRCNVKKKKP
jgi:hypothetical protein